MAAVVAAVAAATDRVGMAAIVSDSPRDRRHAQTFAASPDTEVMRRLTFYPLAIGLFLLVDLALRASGH